MSKQTIEVEVPSGWEAVAYRRPARGEWILGIADGQPCKCVMENYGDDRVIVRKAWRWPDWITAPWIAMGRNGNWFAFPVEPSRENYRDGCWSGGYETWLNPALVAFTPPPCDDWRQSKRHNPNL